MAGKDDARAVTCKHASTLAWHCRKRYRNPMIVSQTKSGCAAQIEASVFRAAFMMSPQSPGCCCRCAAAGASRESSRKGTIATSPFNKNLGHQEAEENTTSSSQFILASLLNPSNLVVDFFGWYPYWLGFKILFFCRKLNNCLCRVFSSSLFMTLSRLIGL